MKRNPQDYFPPDRFEVYPKIAVFKVHQRVKGGRNITVTKEDLLKMADNHNRLWDELGLAAPISLGHTLDHGPDGAEVPEDEQPRIVGNTLNHFVGKLPNGEDALFADLYIRQEDKHVVRDWPGRSVEYYPNRHSYYPLSLLRSSAPELELPVIKYEKEALPDDLKPYTFEMNEPFAYSQTQESESMDKNCDPKDMKKDYEKEPMDKPEDKKPEDAAKDKAVKEESKGAKEDKASTSDLESKVNTLMSFLPVLEQLAAMLSEEGPEGAEGEGKDDLMSPSDKPSPPMDKPSEKDEAKSFEKPVNFEAGMGSATNGYVPGYTKDKDNYKMTNEEVAKYKKQEEDLAKYKAELDATKKIATDLLKKSRLAEAKEMVRELEEVHNIKYASDVERNEDIEMLAALEPKSAKAYVERAKVRYQKKLPDAAGVQEVAKYAVTEEPDLMAKTPEEAQQRALKMIQSGLSPEEFYKKLAEGKAK